MQQQTLFTQGAGTMKHKKAVAAVAIALFVAAFASAQPPRNYYDWENGYSGIAGAEYLGTTRTVDPSQMASMWEQGNLQSPSLRYLRPCSKLSKQENFLIWSALGEYDYNNNEVYGVLIAQGVEQLTLIVVITDARRQRCEWYDAGYWIE